jgi:hypothetical protein
MYGRKEGKKEGLRICCGLGVSWRHCLQVACKGQQVHGSCGQAVHMVANIDLKIQFSSGV